MTQMNIDDYLGNTSKRMVAKDYMNTLDWYVYDTIKLHLGKENAISAKKLAEIFEISERTLRKIIEKIRGKQHAKIIGDDNGYYIGTKKEFDMWFSIRMNRTLSSIETTLNMNPESKRIIYWYLKTYHKDAIQQGQTQLQFNGWEQEFIRQFAEDYEKKHKGEK